jgi:hypothetical protein
MRLPLPATPDKETLALPGSNGPVSSGALLLPRHAAAPAVTGPSPCAACAGLDAGPPPARALPWPWPRAQTTLLRNRSCGSGPLRFGRGPDAGRVPANRIGRRQHGSEMNGEGTARRGKEIGGKRGNGEDLEGRACAVPSFQGKPTASSRLSARGPRQRDSESTPAPPTPENRWPCPKQRPGETPPLPPLWERARPPPPRGGNAPRPTHTHRRAPPAPPTAAGENGRRRSPALSGRRRSKCT